MSALSSSHSAAGIERPCVLVVLSDEALQQYQSDLEAMRRPGVDLLFAVSGEDGLDKLGAVEPQLVIVGEIFELMEGLEFLALVASRYPDFGGRVVVLPDRDDPVVPMCHYKDLASGRSITEEISMDEIMEIVDALAASVPVASSSMSRGGVVAFPRAAVASPAAGAGVSSTADLVDAAPITDAPRSRGAIVAALVVVVFALVAVVAFTLSSEDDSTEHDAPTAESGTEPQAPSEAKDEPAPAATDDDDDEPTIDDAPPPPPDAEPEPEPTVPEPGDAIDTSQPIVLPLEFAQDGTGYTISDPVELDRILGAFKRGLAADPDTRIEVGGHTSKEGAVWLNEAIGERRADAVRRDLVSRGIPEERIVIRSYGASKLEAKGRGVKHRKINRRVTLRIVDAPSR